MFQFKLIILLLYINFTLLYFTLSDPVTSLNFSCDSDIPVGKKCIYCQPQIVQVLSYQHFFFGYCHLGLEKHRSRHTVILNAPPPPFDSFQPVRPVKALI